MARSHGLGQHRYGPLALRASDPNGVARKGVRRGVLCLGQGISRGRAIQCSPTFAQMSETKRRRTHTARRGRSMRATVRAATPLRCNLESNSQGCHAAADAISKAGVRRPGRVVRHALSCLAARGGRLHSPDNAQAERREACRRTPRCCFCRASGCWFDTL
jgi:hypothetical protein